MHLVVVSPAIILPKNLFLFSLHHRWSASTSCARRVDNDQHLPQWQRGRRASNICSADLVRGSRQYLCINVMYVRAHARTFPLYTCNHATISIAYVCACTSFSPLLPVSFDSRAVRGYVAFLVRIYFANGKFDFFPYRVRFLFFKLILLKKWLFY